MAVADLAQRWLDRAEDLEQLAAAQAAATFRRAAAELQAELRSLEGEALTLEQAAQESGYAADSLRHMVRDGRIPNAGRSGAPRIRRGDLPKSPRKKSGYDATADAIALVASRRHA